MTGKKCIQCGKCREDCPVYKVVMKETASPRAKAIFAEAGKLDKIFYLCTLCDAHKDKCPVDADLAVRENRAKLVNEGLTTGPNERMIANIRKFGNPFGPENDNGLGDFGELDELD